MKNLTAIILILISAGLLYTVVLPQYHKSGDLRSRSAEFQNILTNVSSLNDKKQDLLVKYQAMPKEEVDRVNKVLPDNIDTVRLAMDFDSIASKYGISIKNIQTSDNKNANTGIIIQPGSTKPYDSVTVSFSFVATYDNFRKFLGDIEKSLRVIDVKTVDFDSTESGLSDYKISVETYWLK